MTETNSLTQQPGRYVTCYITAKRIHSRELLDLRKDHPSIHFTASWPVVRDISTEQSTPARIWFRNNVDDILRAKTFVCYARPEDVLNESLVELGVAWAHRIPIWLAGENEGFKEWKAAEGIRHGVSRDQALKEIADTIRYDRSDAERYTKALADHELKVHTRLEAISDELRALRGEARIK